MIHEQSYFCWPYHLEESDGIEIMAPSMKVAAKKAIELWKKEAPSSFQDEKIVVYVKDDTRVHEIVVMNDAHFARGSEASP